MLNATHWVLELRHISRVVSVSLTKFLGNCLTNFFFIKYRYPFGLRIGLKLSEK